MKLSFLTAVSCALFLASTAPVYAAETLEQTLASAYQNNPELAAARAKLRATDERVSRALSGWRPSIEVTAEDGTSQQKASGNGIVAQDNTLSPRRVSLNLTQPVFSGFQTTSGVKSAEATVKAERASLQETEQKLLLDAAKAYLDVVQAQNILDLQRENETVLQKKLLKVQDRLNMGELKKTDVSQAQSRFKSATVLRLQAEGDLAAQRATFSRIVGQTPGTLAHIAPTFSLPKTQDEAIATALQNNPSIVAADYSARAAQEDITTATGNLLPTVDIVGSASRAMEQSLTSPTRHDSATMLVRLTVPLYKSGADYAQTRATRETASQKRLELDNARDKAREQAINAWQALMTARDTRIGRLDVITAATEALEGVQIEAKYGTRTTLDVLNAQQELVDAEINLARADRDEALAMLQLKAAIGELTAQALGLPVSIYDPTKNYNLVRNKWTGL